MKKNSKQQKTEARIAAQVIAEEIITNTQPKAPSVPALMHRISSLTKGIAGMNEGPASLALALSEIDKAARAFWKTGSTEARAVMFRITSLTQAAAQHGPESFAFALAEIDSAARGFWKQARA